MTKIFASIFVFSILLGNPLLVFAVTPSAVLNLIPNPSVEVVSTTVPNTPMSWNQGSWGTNNAAFTYPVAGYDGTKAVKVSMTAYTSGDAKWYANDIPVVAGATYTFSDAYQSNVITSIVIRYTSTTNTVRYVDLATVVPASAVWKTTSYNFTVPSGTKSLSVWHILNKVGTLTTDLYSVVDPNASQVDTIKPTVAITAPSAAATLSGVVSVTASSSDNVGVSGVKFYIDDVLLGSEDTTAPYTATWNTALSTNGAHTLSAVARDAAGNTATSSGVGVTVNNGGGTITPANLIANPSLEMFDANGLPVNWFTGSWGTNNAVFSYTATSTDGAASARVDVTSYTDGDAKWYFKDVPVTAGTEYAFSDFYKSSVLTSVIVRYTLTDGSFLYVGLPDAPATSEWQTYSASFTVPAGALSATVFHLIARTGYLAVDSYALSQGSGNITATDLFPAGMVTLTLDDGWMSHYTEALPILNAAGVKGVFGIISQETIQAVPDNRIGNPSLELMSGGMPLGWNFAVTGSNNAIASYPTQGQDGASAASIIMTSRTSGDASWSFDDTSIIPAQDYTYTEYYRSNAPSTVTLRIHLSDNSYVTTDLDTLPAAGTATWTQYSRVFHVPANALTLTIFHRLTAVGTLSIDNTDLDRVQVYVNPAMVLEIEAGGHEIASHTQHHPSLLMVPNSTMLAEVNNSRSDLLGIGVNSVQTFIYPYGDYNGTVELAVKNAGYIGARSVVRGFNTKSTDKYALKIQQVGVTDTPAQIQTYIDTAVADKTWLILMFHQIGYGGEEFSTTPETFASIVNYLKTQQVPVVTLSQGLGMMGQ